MKLLIYLEMFRCQVGMLPMEYLGVLVSVVASKNSNWDFIDAKLFKNWMLRWAILCLHVVSRLMHLNSLSCSYVYVHP
jgi:hypothetical protein